MTDGKILKYGIGISWLTCWNLIIPVSVVATIVTIYKLAIRKSKLTKYAIILSPFLVLPMINMGMGIVDYYRSNAKIKLIGYPSPEFANIDHKYRIENESLGCASTGTEYLASFRYNQTVKILIDKFGYQKNSYTGVMPSKNEAKEYLFKKECKLGEVEFVEGERISIAYNSTIYHLNLNNQHKLIRKTLVESKLNQNPKLKLIDSRLICQLNNNWIYLIDLEKNKIIAQYEI